MRKQHSLSAAETSRDSFAKALYDRLFTWIVGHVNAAIDPSLTESAVDERVKFFWLEYFHLSNYECRNYFQGYNIIKSSVIGVLDIYGFEVFDNNSFEQVK